MNNLYLVTFLIALSQLLDWYSTRTILGRGGYEQNPVASKGMKLLGVNGYLGVKSVVVTVLGYFAGTQSLWLALTILLVFVGVLVHNWKSMP